MQKIMTEDILHAASWQTFQPQPQNKKKLYSKKYLNFLTKQSLKLSYVLE